MILINELTKKFKRRGVQKNRKVEDLLALDNISLNINKGEIFGLIGPNGAGKTTTLKILSTLVIPDEGTVTIDGYDVVKNANIVKNKIGLLSAEFARSLYWRLTGRQNIEFFAKLKNMQNAKKRIDELFEKFDLTKWQNELIMKYSTGMKHKLALAVGLLNDPPVLFLDEPLTGMDPISANEIKTLIKNTFKDKTIIWASHNLFEVEQMCNRIALINNGKIVIQGNPEELKKNYWNYEKIMILVDNGEVFLSLKNAEVTGNYIEIKTRDVNSTILEITKLAEKNCVKIKEIRTIRPTLEDIFIKGVETC